MQGKGIEEFYVEKWYNFDIFKRSSCIQYEDLQVRKPYYEFLSSDQDKDDSYLDEGDSIDDWKKCVTNKHVSSANSTWLVNRMGYINNSEGPKRGHHGGIVGWATVYVTSIS